MVSDSAVERLEGFKQYARRALGKWEEQRWCGGTRDQVEIREHEGIKRSVDRFVVARQEGIRLQKCTRCNWVGYPKQEGVCTHCKCEECLTSATAKDFLWTGMDGGPKPMPEFYGVPEDLQGVECLRWLGEASPEEGRQLMQEACVELRNLDRLISMTDGDGTDGDGTADEYYNGDLRQYESINLFEGEEIDDVLAVEANSCKTKYYAEPFEVVLDSGAGDHVADDTDAPGYVVNESKGSKARQNFIAAGGHKIPNRGEMVLSLRSRGEGGGREITTTFQVAKVTRPLWSVARICDAGCDVKLTAAGAKVINKKGKTMCSFDRVGNLYKAKLDLRNPNHESFGRQGLKA